MTNDAFVVVIANLALIGLLPFVFFRRDGSFNARWWLTGLPFFLTAAGVVAVRVGLSRPWAASPAASSAADLLALAAVGVLGWTVGSHRVPLALWHQDQDAPASIVSWGPYKYVRHPFYASFLLTQTSALLASPNPLTAFGFAYAIVALSMTARREEARLLISALGDQYRRYMATTGRLLPGIGRSA
jgi:protein-S-isoprenylcysteine O-methyltransferase Ste14